MEPPPTEEELDLDHHPKLLLFSLPSLRWSPDPTRLDDPDPPGARTPPLHTHASVPFLWEAAPGKPKHTSTLPQQPSLQYPSPNPSPNPNPDHPNPNSRVLDLPPRLAKFTKMPSPTTVLEGPYPSLLGRSILEASSFRGFGRRRGGSFDGALGGGSSPERGLLGPSVGLTSSGSYRKEEDRSKGVFGCWRKRAGGVSFSFRGGSCKSSVVRGGSFVISGEGGSGGGGGGVGGRKKRLLRWSPSKTHFWANIYGAFKQIIPKTSSTKWKKDDS